jgi:hypothetical protein
MIDGKPPNPGGETFVEPQFTPPIHSDQVTKPLMSELMGHNVSYPVTVADVAGSKRRAVVLGL